MQHLSQDPRAPDFVQNPYPFYHRARAGGPLFHWQEYGHACAVSHLAVNTLLRDRRFGREAPEGFAVGHEDHLEPFYAVEQHSILELEPPTHTRLRSLLTRAFTNRQISALEPGIAKLAEDTVAGFDGNEIDLLPAFCEIIPILTICRLLGVPAEMADQLLMWSHDMVAMYQSRRDRAIEDAAVTATQEFRDYILRHIAARRTDPRDDLITRLISARDEGEKLSTDELVSTCILLLNAGHEATVHSFANGIKTLIVTGQPPLAFFRTPQTGLETIEETLRFDPPLHMFTRYAMEDVTVFEQDFQKGETVGLILAAANRDPLKYQNPDNFDVRRGSVGHLAFGAGLHFCIGAPLAKLEMAIALPILFRAFPHMSLGKTPVYADRYHFHGLEKLYVRCRPPNRNLGG